MMPHSPTPPSPSLDATDLPPPPMLTKTSPPPMDTPTPPDSAESSDSEHRARSRSRSPSAIRKRRARQAPSQLAPTAEVKEPATTTNGHLLSPPSTAGWRSFSRSPSPLGLIPIHKTFSSLVHRYEVPRKTLHVSIGFLVLYLYRGGVQPSAITPVLGCALIPIVTADVLRFVFPSFNWLYIRVLGALMRETEYARWNGVIWYLLGSWTVLTVFPKDVATLSILLLSWCDTAASTFGRLFGKYTFRLRKGKSFAGSLAAFAVGAATTVYFYGKVVPETPFWPNDPTPALYFHDRLAIPGLGEVKGGVALGILSAVSGLIGTVSEVIDLWGFDDNVVIPIVSAAGILGFLKIFG